MRIQFSKLALSLFFATIYGHAYTSNFRLCKQPFLALLLVLVGTSNLVYAANQNNFYGVWLSKDNTVFCEISKETINLIGIDDNKVSKYKYRIVKWETAYDGKGYAIYTLSESGEKRSFPVWIDVYSDLHIVFNIGTIAEMKKSSTAELNKRVQDIETAAKTAKAIAEAKVADKAKATAERLASLQGSFTDSRDSKKYKTIQIGKQTWLAENLNYNASGSKCYSNSEANCAKYGRLYDWATAMVLSSSCNTNSCSSQISAKHRGICPAGWHIPSDADWDVLVNYAGGGWTAGGKLKATSERNEDKFGFAALLGGSGNPYYGGSFNGVGNEGYWWSASEEGANYALFRRMNFEDEIKSYYDPNNKGWLYSIRCLQD